MQYNLYGYCSGNPINYTDPSGHYRYHSYPRHSIKHGSKDSKNIKVVQKRLNALRFKGMNGKKLAVDGRFEPNTLRSVKTFQKAQGITVDGRVGPQTWVQLFPTGSRVSWNVPLYNQGNRSLCWAYSQTMIESFRNGNNLTQKGANSRAKQIAVSVYGKNNWNQAGWPTNKGRDVFIKNINDLFRLVVARGPVYGYYCGNNGAHEIVIRGVDLRRGKEGI